jgi:hypothetical protein
MDLPNRPPCFLIQIRLSWAADALALGLGVPHSCADALDDQAAFQFGDRSKNRKNQLASGRGCIELLRE